VTDPAGHKPDQNLSPPGLCEIEFGDVERLPELLEHSGSDLH
jgi:hypothetical protein